MFVRRRYRVTLLVACVLLGACGGPANHRHSHATAIPHLYAYDYKDVRDHLRVLTGQDVEVPEANGRSPDGTTLYWSFTSRKVVLANDAHGKYRTIASKGAAVNFMDRNGSLLAWFDLARPGVEFRAGKLISVSRVERFGLDYSGEYGFLSSLQDQTAKFFRSDMPEAAVAMIPHAVHAIYIRDQTIYAFEYHRAEAGSGLVKDVWCHILKVSGGEVAFDRSVLIPRPEAGVGTFTVDDMDPWSGRVLLRDNTRRGIPQWLLYDFDSRELLRIGDSKNYGVFLQGDVFGG